MWIKYLEWLKSKKKVVGISKIINLLSVFFPGNVFSFLIYHREWIGSESEIIVSGVEPMTLETFDAFVPPNPFTEIVLTSNALSRSLFLYISLPDLYIDTFSHWKGLTELTRLKHFRKEINITIYFVWTWNNNSCLKPTQCVTDLD